jgi:hypothetical protein
VTRWLVAFGLTVAVEAPVYLLGLVGLHLATWRRAVALAIGVNVVTHPMLWAFLTWYRSPGAYVAAELAVVVAEAALLRLAVHRDLGALLALSLAANTTSVLVGLLFI